MPTKEPPNIRSEPDRGVILARVLTAPVAQVPHRDLPRHPPQFDDGVRVRGQQRRSADGKLEAFTVSNSSTLPKWQVSQGPQSHSGKWAAWYGNASKGNFDDGATSGELHLPPAAVPVTGKSKLKFWLYQDTEIDEKYDLLKVFAVGTTNALWFSWQQEGMRAETWQEWVVDVSACAGKTVELYFDFDTVDKCYIGGQGVFVDDVRVERGCP